MNQDEILSFLSKLKLQEFLLWHDGLRIWHCHIKDIKITYFYHNILKEP